jgi:hypothetical protein
MTLEDIELIKSHRESALFLVFKKLCKEYREKMIDQLTKASSTEDLHFIKGKIVVLQEISNSVDFYAAFNSDKVATLQKK